MQKILLTSGRGSFRLFVLSGIIALASVCQANTTCTPAASGLVGWWQAEGNADDVIGSDNGTLQGGATFAPGEAGQGFRFDGTNGYVQIPDSDALKPTNVTVEAWVWLDPSLPSGRGGEQIVFKKNTWSAWFEGYSLLKVTIDNGNGTSSERFQFCVSRFGNQVVINSQTIAQRGIWYHVAATYDGNQSILYVNGVAEATATPGFALDYDTTPVFIGTSGTWPPYLSMFGGTIDEVSIYNRALAPNEIAAIYNAGTDGKCPPPPTPPAITSQPINQTLTVGQTATFSVSANGTSPLSYQWQFDGTNISGATNPILTLANVQTTNAGIYSVVVTNIAGATNSTNATLTVNLPGACSPAPSGLVGWWPAEGNANDIIGGDNGTLNGGATFAPGEVGQGFHLDGTNSYVEIPDSDALKPANVTVEAWVWLDPAAANPGTEVIVFKRNSWTYLFEGYNLAKEQLDSVTSRFSFVIARDGNQVITRSTTLAQRGVWYHVAGTYDGTTATIWVNGVPEATSYAGFALDYGPKPVFIGQTGEPAPYVDMFAGIIDEPAIYNRALASNEIAAIYNAGTGGKCVAAVTPPVVPASLNFTPAVAPSGMNITISGTNFSTIPAENIVYFGAVRAIVTSASPTSLTVTVPVGATFAPITVTTGGLTTYSLRPFLPTFAGTGVPISTASFGPRQNLESGNGPIQVVIADVDNDGKPDLIVANDYNNTISLYRNISTNHTLTAASFASPVDLATPPGTYSPYGIVAADVDGDGKLDIIATQDADPSVVSVYRNTCTPGDISASAFATRVDFPTGPNPQGVAVGDIDGDGKTDLLVANTGDGTVSILRNTSVVGSLTAGSFAPKVDFTTGDVCANVTVGDIDGDGIPDVVAANAGNGMVSLLHNISSPGHFAFNTKVDFTTPGYPIHVRLVDLDGDGKLDVTVEGYLPQTMSVFRNISTAGSLTASSLAPRIDFALGGRGHTTAVGDLDGDGRPDLTVATELDSMISIFQNTGTPGGFTESSLGGRVDFSTGWNAWGVTVGDLDGDGRPDVVFANAYEHNISIYQNLSPVAGNHPPVADASATSPLIISLSNTNAMVVLDGSLSSDPDGDSLQYYWYETNAVTPVATGVVAVVVLPVGTNSITLSVSDGLATNQQTIAVEVITTAQATQRLLDLVTTDVAKAQSLEAILSAAIKSIDRSNPTAAINELQAFQNQITAQIAPLDPTLADTLINDAQIIIDDLAAGGANVHGKISATINQANGQFHLKFSAPHGKTYIIEASTDLVHWQMIGVAKVQNDGTFDFGDESAMRMSGRFYRVMVP